MSSLRGSEPSTGGTFLDIFATSIPARAFTGDFFHFHETSDGMWIAVGDVAGKGLHAAVYMAMIQEQLEAVADCKHDLREVMSSMNRLLREVMPSNRFATMTLATICNDGTASVANAGHPPALVRRPSGRVERVPSNGPALAMFDHGFWRASRFRLEPGDSLVLYTDGLSEAGTDDGQEFGVEGIEKAVAAAPHHSSHVLGNTVLNAVRRFGRLSDDATLLAARVPKTHPAA